MKKKTLHDKFAFNNNSPQIKYIAEKNKNTKKKNKSKCEGSTNKSTKIPKYFEIFIYKNRAYLAKYQTTMDIKIMVKV
jgi:hypothetical protein